jgi:hypothetical protein
MSERYNARVEIGGHLTKAQMPELLGLLNDENVGDDWGHDYKAELVEAGLRTAALETRTCVLYVQEITADALSDLGVTLAGMGLAVVTYCDGQYEYDGEITYYDPAGTSVTRLSNNNAGEPVVKLSELKRCMGLSWSLQAVINDNDVPKPQPFKIIE